MKKMNDFATHSLLTEIPLFSTSNARTHENNLNLVASLSTGEVCSPTIIAVCLALPFRSSRGRLSASVRLFQACPIRIFWRITGK